MSDQSTDHLLLGEIKGIVSGLRDRQATMDGKLDAIDTRMRAQEQKAVISSGVTGGLVAIGVSLLVEKLKRSVGMS